MDVSIIIVNYKTVALTTACINSIFSHTRGVEFEIIVVDNASADGSVEQFLRDPRVKVIPSPENVGFGRANNLGAKSATGKYLFFLNSDTILLNNAVKLFFDFMELNADLKIGMIGGFLKNGNHVATLSGGCFPSVSSELNYLIKSIYRKCINRKWVPSEIRCVKQDVDWISGADLFTSRQLFEELSGFDPRFFMYYEETDLQKRAAKAGYKRMLISGPEIIHLEGGSDGEQKKFSFFMLMHSSRSLLLYMKKHYHGVSYLWFRLLMLILRLNIFFKSSFSGKEKMIFLKFFWQGIGPLEQVNSVASNFYQQLGK